MKTLYLIRHAETVNSQENGEDKDRRLNANGVYQSLQLGAHLKEHNIRPNLILCSTAVRARETLQNLLNHMETEDCCIRHDDNLYMCCPNNILKMLYSLSDDMSSVMLIAHNPGLGELAMALAKHGNEDKIHVLKSTSYPTGALSVFNFDVESWGMISDDTAYLKDFIIAKAQPLGHIS